MMKIVKVDGRKMKLSWLINITGPVKENVNK